MQQLRAGIKTDCVTRFKLQLQQCVSSYVRAHLHASSQHDSWHSLGGEVPVCQLPTHTLTGIQEKQLTALFHLL